ncbi:MAG: CopD family protein [Nitrospirota bacterium]
MTSFIHTIPEWFELGALTFCIGLLACRLWVFPLSVYTGLIEQDNILDTTWNLLAVCAAVMMVSSSVNLILRAAEMSGNSLSTVFPVLPAVIFRTHLGRAWLIRIVCLVLLLISLLAGGRRSSSRGLMGLMLGIAIIIAMTESASGHASDKGDFSVPEIMDFLHLLAAGVWGGGLFALSLVVLPKLTRAADQAAASLADVARRFSRLAGVAVGVIAITAIYNAWSYVGSFGPAWKSPYGLTVLAKIIIFLLLVLLGAFNRYVSVPLLIEWGGASFSERVMVPRVANHFLSRFLRDRRGMAIALLFKRTVRIEALLMVGALLCAAMLRHDIPARHFFHVGHEHNHHPAQGPAPVVSLETEPSAIKAGSPVKITVRMKDPGGMPLQGLAVSHERILHMLIIGQDMRSFAHIHPEDVGSITGEMLQKAVFPLRFTFPKAGEYLVGVDFFSGDDFYSQVFRVSVGGRPAMGAPEMDLSTRRTFGEYTVTFATSPMQVKAGEETSLRYVIEKDGRPVTDLGPYLGAAMHIAVVSDDLKRYIHAHGTVPGEPHAHHDHMHSVPPKRFGPEIESDVVFPVKGIYTIFSQVKHGDKVLRFDFMVNVQ